MSPTELLFLAIPAALGVFKLTVLSLAAIWSIRAAFELGGFLPASRLHETRMPARTRAVRA